MSNTRLSFADKWTRNSALAFAETLREGSDFFNWILSRNGFDTPAALSGWLNGARRVLDAGCGNGRVTALLRQYAHPRVEIVGIDLVAARVAAENLLGAPNVFFEEADLLGDLRSLGQFEIIYCQEVLHHTGDPRRAFLNLVDRLTPDGEIAIYVYKRKAPVREYVDDFVRDRVSGLPYEAAMARCEQIARFGKALSDLRTSVTVPAVDVLGIPEGTYDVQRLFYHFFMKCYWNPDLSAHDNAVVNYDWYHPQDCTRHTIEEVREWFSEARLRVVHEHVDFYGITMRGTRGDTVR